MDDTPKRLGSTLPRRLTEGYQPKAEPGATPDSALKPPASPSPIKRALRLTDLTEEKQKTTSSGSSTAEAPSEKK